MLAEFLVLEHLSSIMLNHYVDGFLLKRAAIEDSNTLVSILFKTLIAR